MAQITEIDLDGHVDGKGIQYIGRATRRPDGSWRCLAVVGGCLCTVEFRITGARVGDPFTTTAVL